MLQSSGDCMVEYEGMRTTALMLSTLQVDVKLGEAKVSFWSHLTSVAVAMRACCTVMICSQERLSSMMAFPEAFNTLMGWRARPEAVSVKL